MGSEYRMNEWLRAEMTWFSLAVVWREKNINNNFSNFQHIFGLVELLSCCHVSYEDWYWASEIDFCEKAERGINLRKYISLAHFSLSTLGKMGQTEFLLFFHRSSLNRRNTSARTHARVELRDETQWRRRCRSSSVIANRVSNHNTTTTLRRLRDFYTKFSTLLACKFDNKFFLNFTLLFFPSNLFLYLSL